MAGAFLVGPGCAEELEKGLICRAMVAVDMPGAVVETI